MPPAPPGTIALSPRVRIEEAEGATHAVVSVATWDGTLRFRLDLDGGRLRVGLLVTGRERPLDVTTEPAVVVAALSASLLPQGPASAPPALHPMALAIMGAPILPPDGLVRVLQAGTHDRQPPPDGLPTIDDITRFRLVVCDLGAARVERLLIDAASRADGPRLLSETAQLLGGLPAGARGRLPTRLDALHQRCRELTPVDPRPRADAAPASVAEGRPDQPVMRRRHTAPGNALAPPSSRRARAASPGGLSYSPAIWQLHGAEAGPRLRLVLPRSVREIRLWGQRLHNCLGTYAGAAAAGESLLIGVERLDVLTYCAEINSRRKTLRQFLGPYNRSVSPVDAVAVCALLLDHRLLDPQQPTNRPWMELCRTIDPDRSLAQTTSAAAPANWAL